MFLQRNSLGTHESNEADSSVKAVRTAENITVGETSVQIRNT